MGNTDENEEVAATPESTTPPPAEGEGAKDKDPEAGTKSETPAPEAKDGGDAASKPKEDPKPTEVAPKDKAKDVKDTSGDKEAEKEPSKEEGVTQPAVVPVTPPAPEPELKKAMRAVVLASYGGLKGIRVGDRPHPPPPPKGNVTIQVKISGLNFHDLLQRLGIVDVVPTPKTPIVLGTECIGLVTAVGEMVTKVKVDDLVFALPEGGGAWTEFINLEERFFFKVTQPSIPLIQLGMTYPYLVAQLLLNRVAGLEEGSNILIHSAGGGVGLALKDLASLRKMNVYGVAGQGKHEALGGHGFKALVKRGGADYVTEVKKLCPDGMDAVFDPQGGDDAARGISLLAPYGSYVLFGTANIVTGENRGLFGFAKSWWSQVEKVSPMKLYEENKSVGGVHLRHMLKTNPARVERALATVWDLMAQDKLQPVVDSTVHYEQIALGMGKMHERKNIGKILVLPEVQVVAGEEVKAEGGAAVEGETGAK